MLPAKVGAQSRTRLAAWVFPEVRGLAMHGQTGMMIIPIVVLLFLIVSFLARIPHGRVLALVVGLTALQIFLGMTLHVGRSADTITGVCVRRPTDGPARPC